MLRHTRKRISVSSAPSASAKQALAVIGEAIPETVHEDLERTRVAQVGSRIVAEVPSILPSVVIKRRLSDAGIDADVDTIVRFVR
jgi:hypothetical protein